MKIIFFINFFIKIIKRQFKPNNVLQRKKEMKKARQNKFICFTWKKNLLFFVIYILLYSHNITLSCYFFSSFCLWLSFHRKSVAMKLIATFDLMLDVNTKTDCCGEYCYACCYELWCDRFFGLSWRCWWEHLHFCHFTQSILLYSLSDKEYHFPYIENRRSNTFGFIVW